MKISAIWSAILLFVQLSCAITYEKVLQNVGKDGLLHINDKNFLKSLKNDDYSLIIFITAEDPRVGCTICHEFGPQYKAMAYQYMNNLRSEDPDTYNPISDSNDKARVIFAYSDFSDSRKYFEQLGLASVPRLFYYEPGKGPQLATFSDEYSFLVSENIENFQNWVAQNVPKLLAKNLKIAPPDQKPLFLLSIVLIVMTAIVLYNFRENVAKIAQNRYVWQILCFVLIILFISGHMYNEIRHTDSYKKDREGNIIYISPGHQNQFGAETQILTVVYGAITIALGLLLSYFPTVKDAKLKVVGTVISCIVVSILYTYIVEMYHIKSPGYPLHLFNVFAN
ncbi:oligosaccharyl transferase subunit ost3/OST6 [Pichia californica]|uniref:Oligosaccharyl transferase subunit ost3/OST6 n=1 Tax=Pichia californica TaxID=460514 RepID=A0A9P6WN33_9ASCO|nr:oligosaccharyl transferase subunit ost3/OST6 [[Candida] californica]KAG0689966.1 oligosaccharyl transferase subunit ost3/OST6 [[Candida] californica]